MNISNSVLLIIAINALTAKEMEQGVNQMAVFAGVHEPFLYSIKETRKIDEANGDFNQIELHEAVTKFLDDILSQFSEQANQDSALIASLLKDLDEEKLIKEAKEIEQKFGLENSLTTAWNAKTSLIYMSVMYQETENAKLIENYFAQFNGVYEELSRLSNEEKNKKEAAIEDYAQAIENDNVEAVQKLVDEYGIDINEEITSRNYVKTGLIFAMEKQSYKVAQYMVKNGAEIFNSWSDRSPFHNAVLLGKGELVKLMMESPKFSPEEVLNVNSYFFNGSFSSSFKAHSGLECVFEQLVTTFDLQNNSDVITSVIKEAPCLLPYLTKHGAVIYPESNENEYFHIASRAQSKEAIDALIAAGGDINCSKGFWSYSALVNSVQPVRDGSTGEIIERDVDFINYLISKGGQIVYQSRQYRDITQTLSDLSELMSKSPQELIGMGVLDLHFDVTNEQNVGFWKNFFQKESLEMVKYVIEEHKLDYQKLAIDSSRLYVDKTDTERIAYFKQKGIECTVR
jgi:ankyrin repeat protein